MNNGAPNVAAITAAIKDAEEVPSSLPSAGFGRRHTVSRGFAGRGSPTSLLTSRLMADRKAETSEHAIDDDPRDGSPENGTVGGQQKSRMRRASDGQPLTKEGRKSSRVELRCEKCGKGYKHSSCLTKHLFVPPPPVPSFPASRFSWRCLPVERNSGPVANTLRPASLTFLPLQVGAYA